MTPNVMHCVFRIDATNITNNNENIIRPANANFLDDVMCSG